MNQNNKLIIKVLPLKQNIGFVRSAVCAFALSLFDRIEDINDIKTSVSEAFTNCVIHSECDDFVEIEVEIIDKTICIVIKDNGKGIDDVSQAMQPFFTTKQVNERSGMGFTLMQAFMDSIEVNSVPNKGTTVTLKKSMTE